MLPNLHFSSSNKERSYCTDVLLWLLETIFKCSPCENWAEVLEVYFFEDQILPLFPPSLLRRLIWELIMKVGGERVSCLQSLHCFLRVHGEHLENNAALLEINLIGNALCEQQFLHILSPLNTLWTFSFIHSISADLAGRILSHESGVFYDQICIFLVGCVWFLDHVLAQKNLKRAIDQNLRQN